MNPRQQRARQMMQVEGYCSQFDRDKFRVRSQTDPSKSYVVTDTGNGLVCECPDHQTRKVDCEHIKVVLEQIKRNQNRMDHGFRIIGGKL